VAVEAPREPAAVVDLMAALKASLAAAGDGQPDEAEKEEEEKKPAAKSGGRGRKPAGEGRGGKKDQLSIEHGRLRTVPGGKRGGRASEEAKEDEAQPARRRTRKAS